MVIIKEKRLSRKNSPVKTSFKEEAAKVIEITTPDFIKAVGNGLEGILFYAKNTGSKEVVISNYPVTCNVRNGMCYLSGLINNKHKAGVTFSLREIREAVATIKNEIVKEYVLRLKDAALVSFAPER